jgi:threonine synthase
LLGGLRTAVVRLLFFSEALLREANQLAVSATGIRADPTGSAGLAGLLELRRSRAIGDAGRAAVLLTGIQRQ